MLPLKISNSRSMISSGFNDPQFSDFMLEFSESGTVLHVHKFMLACHSLFFKTCFTNTELTECREGKMIIDSSEDSEDIFTEMIKSFYCGNVDLQRDEWAVEMLRMAGKYQVTCVESVLINHLCENLNDKTMILCWTLDTDNLKYKELMDKAKQYLLSHSRETLNSDVYLSLDASAFYQVLNVVACADLLDVCIDAIEKWIEHDTDQRAEYSYSLLKLVNKLRKERKSSCPTSERRNHPPRPPRATRWSHYQPYSVLE